MIVAFSASTVQSTTCVNCIFKKDERRGEHLKHGNQTNGVTCFQKGTFLLQRADQAKLFAPVLKSLDKRQGQLTGNIELILCPSAPLRLLQLTALKNWKRVFPFLYLWAKSVRAVGKKKRLISKQDDNHVPELRTGRQGEKKERQREEMKWKMNELQRKTGVGGGYFIFRWMKDSLSRLSLLSFYFPLLHHVFTTWERLRSLPFYF